MDDQQPSVSGEASNVSCSCRSTCSTKRAGNCNRGCHCRTAGVSCSAQCKCGSQSKPCRNKASESTGNCPASGTRNFQNHYSSALDRPSEEAERVKENQDVKDFIQTLDDQMVRKLCVRSLQRGIGSMDNIYGLLIMEDDDDSDHENDGEGSTAIASGSSVEQTPVAAALPSQDPEPGSSSSPPWCKCNQCIVMPQEIENKCCNQRRCVTSFERFAKLCVDPDVLQLCIRNRADIRNDRDDNSTRAFRKAAYRQYVLDRYGYLGKGNRKV